MNATETLQRDAIRARSLRLEKKAASYAEIELGVSEHALREPAENEVVVQILAAAVNPSDAKAATGLMPYAVFPRTPGRDFAGRVIRGPEALVGQLVFGSSGDLGIRADGTHSSHLVVEADAVVPVPEAISVEEAAGVGVPFVTAWEGFARAGLPEATDTVLVLGVNGKVGQAAVQIATWRGARVIGVSRKAEPYIGHANGPVDMIDSSSEDVPQRVRELTEGRGATIVFNTVGDPAYEIGQASMAPGGRAIFIAAVKRLVTFDILAFYKGRHTYIGVDTIALGSVASGAILRQVMVGLASGALRPFPILPHAVYPLSRAYDAYQLVAGSTRDRVILVPEN
ncbi:zinc-binding alcohol dehydrogenase family protein [Ensifer adhaerens]|uniref:quinone oxidoreductase family protein n=1 Tax=Ensifer adhaerens TaxID=106592 RepID=UPI001CBC472E|nr:zinc-binding alcohol dehydrogenase family protein [Ensifer adhaerens]MBZ7924791.1 zinc-binding alcohol dehydrogenase family protein [Ensifer adhaerens]UAX95988.1 zinc-binding alcohol dehydrogenase family protein [Ensifer adhaerens]UAY04670.1 zinc-binding alcohol dehydrogenase family protein [Ensifer adhaerens]UAY10101.1 zinc-binding alcohol dehydrogenase family protein [Ensifer adhaerens]